MKKILQSSIPAILITCLIVSVWGFALQVTAEDDGVTLDTTVLISLSCVVDSGTKSLSDLTPGTPNTAETTLTITTNDADGFNVKVARDDADTTMDLSTDAAVNITDQTDWTSGTPNGALKAALDSSGDVLAFKVKQTGTDTDCYNSTWWGSDDTDPNALYTGFPTPSDTIVNDSVFESAAVDVVVLYYVDVAGSQKTGLYNGGITYSTTGNP